MNLSHSHVANCTAGKREDRPDWSDDLCLQRRVGWQEGSPAIDPFEKVPLDGQIDDYYEEYLRRDELFRPEADSFLTDLFDSELITALEDASDEINTDESTIRQAADLHGIEIPEGDSDGHESDPEELVFPSGESWSLEYFCESAHEDPRVLTQLLAGDGLSVKETARYLSDRLDTNVSESDVKDAARACNLL